MERERSADVDAVNNVGLSALHAAAHHGYASVVDALLDGGADVALRTNSGETARELARREEHNDVVALLEGGARTRKARPTAATSGGGGAAAADGGGFMPRLRRNFGARTTAEAEAAQKEEL